MSLKDIISALISSQHFTHKMDIGSVLSTLDKSLPNGINRTNDVVILGDDCAAIPDGDGFLLYAIEGMMGEFVRELPWFAGYSSVMVNISDIYAMGGRPIAVVDALWSDGQVSAEKILQGMAAASKAYGVPIVGGHSNTRSNQSQLAVSIIGRATKLLSSFNARPNDKLMMAVDLRGRFEGIYPYWNASSKAIPLRLREDLEILPMLAEQGLCDAAKDISMAGVLGTALMLLECSGVGANIHLDQIPIPENVPMLRWLSAFPSYGFLMSVRPEHCEEVKKIFHARYLACAEIGEVVSGDQVALTQGDEEGLLWGFDKANFILPAEHSHNGFRQHPH